MSTEVVSVTRFLWDGVERLYVTLLTTKAFPQSLFPQCVYTGPGEGRFGCWKWSYITI